MGPGLGWDRERRVKGGGGGAGERPSVELPTAVYYWPQEMELGPGTLSSLKIVYGLQLCRLGDFGLLPTNFGQIYVQTWRPIEAKCADVLKFSS